jgi:hypothetical protein
VRLNIVKCKNNSQEKKEDIPQATTIQEAINDMFDIPEQDRRYIVIDTKERLVIEALPGEYITFSSPYTYMSKLKSKPETVTLFNGQEVQVYETLDKDNNTVSWRISGTNVKVKWDRGNSAYETPRTIPMYTIKIVDTEEYNTKIEYNVLELPKDSYNIGIFIPSQRKLVMFNKYMEETNEYPFEFPD